MPKITCCPCFRTYTLLRLIDQLIYEMKIINDSRQTDTPPFRPFFVSCCFPRHTGNTLRFIHSSLAPLNTPNCGSIEQKTSLPSTYWHLIRWHERETSEPPRLWARKAILIRIIGALLIARSEIHLIIIGWILNATRQFKSTEKESKRRTSRRKSRHFVNNLSTQDASQNPMLPFILQSINN